MHYSGEARGWEVHSGKLDYGQCCGAGIRNFCLFWRAAQLSIDYQIAGRTHIIENQSASGINRFISNRNRELIREWYKEKAYIYDSRIVDYDEKEDLLKSVERAVMQYGIKVVLIDNLMTAMYLDEKS